MSWPMCKGEEIPQPLSMEGVEKLHGPCVGQVGIFHVSCEGGGDIRAHL